uniref:Uncharacterized protein n=1 Tax=Aplanochytrium stocchinoi TaxID=215587 RepID=A0A7S3V0D3_9STRA|mmetsp:Transcript_2743/g.3476  ORF Transcript_2743/g.3476 Transcript_2743/m.3476 type:complete len:313 (+) Transcript_2743:89-1027(+)
MTCEYYCILIIYLQFVFFMDSPSEISSLPCDANETVLFYMYIFCALTGTVALLMLVLVVKTWSQAKRLVFPSTVLSLTVIGSSLRVLSNKPRLFGQDVVFTLVFSIAPSVLVIEGQVFFIKFVEYLLRKFPLLETKRFTTRFLRMQFVFRFVVLIACMCAIIGSMFSFFKYQQPTLRVLYTLFALGHTLSSSLTIFSVWYLIGYLRVEISLMIHGKKDLVLLDEDTKIKLRRLLPKLRIIQYGVFVVAGEFLIFFLPTLFSEYFSAYWKYNVPILYGSYNMVAILNVRQQSIIAINKRKKFAKVVEYKDLLR